MAGFKPWNNIRFSMRSPFFKSLRGSSIACIVVSVIVLLQLLLLVVGCTIGKFSMAAEDVKVDPSYSLVPIANSTNK
jgi:hypothetical protein